MHTREAIAVKTGREAVKETTRAVVEALRTSMGQGRMPLLEVTSNSMTPLLRRGDRVGLVAARLHDLRRGDIVTFLEGDHLTTHRFWGRAAGGLHSRSDRSGAFDRPWNAEALVGRVVVRRRNGTSFWLNAGVGGQLNRFLYALSAGGQRLMEAGLPRRIVRAAWLFLAVPAVSASGLLARAQRPNRAAVRPEEST